MRQPICHVAPFAVTELFVGLHPTVEEGRSWLGHDDCVDDGGLGQLTRHDCGPCSWIENDMVGRLDG